MKKLISAILLIGFFAATADGQVLYHSEKKHAFLSGDTTLVAVRHTIHEFSDSLYQANGEPYPEKLTDPNALDWKIADPLFLSRHTEVFVYTTRDSQYTEGGVTYKLKLQDTLLRVEYEALKKIPGVNAIHDISGFIVPQSKKPPKDTATAKSNFTKHKTEIDSIFATRSVTVELPFKP